MKLEYSRIKELIKVFDNIEEKLEKPNIFDEVWLNSVLDDLFIYICELGHDILPFELTDKHALFPFLVRNETLEDYIKDVEENSTEVKE